MHRFRALLRPAGVRRLVLFGLLGRLPIGMTGLAALLLVQERTGSFAVAGAVTATYSLAFAGAAPVLGRLVDRLGPRRVIRVLGVAHPLALLALLGAALTAPPVVVAAAAAVAGASVPPITSIMRALWADVVTEPELRQAAFALESTLIEIGFVLGPALVGVLVAVADPGFALVVSATLAAVGSLGLAAHPLVAGRAGTGTRPASWAGPLTSGRLRALLGVGVLVAGAFGVLEVTLPAYADERDARAAAGGLLAVWAFGSALGGLWYGARGSASRIELQYLALLASLPLGFLPLLAAPPIWLAVPLLVLAGLAIAPLFTVTFSLVSTAAPAGTVTEAFTWVSSLLSVGIAAGTALGGALVDSAGGARAGVLAAIGFGLTATAAGALVARRLPRAALDPVPA